MSSLSTVEAKLPPGFRFHPRDDELICDYLMKWTAGCAHPLPLLIEVDLNKCEPWDLPDVACVGGKEWYFYSQRDRKYATGLRTNRATVSGYWKATGKDRPVIRKGILVGMRKTLVFYQGRAPKGWKSDWVMHEFRMEGSDPRYASHVKKQDQADWVLCRVFFKSRSETPSKSQETATHAPPSSPPLPPLMDPFTAFGPSDHEQVPCFSIFNTTSPSFSLLSHMDPHPAKMISNYGSTIPDLGMYNPPPLTNIDPSSCDKKMIRAVLNHITKMESGNDQISVKGGSPSFGEGSSDSYLSEVGLSSMWNQYS